MRNLYRIIYHCGCWINSKNPVPEHCEVHPDYGIRTTYSLEDFTKNNEVESADQSKVITGSEQRRRLAEKEAEQARNLPELYKVLIGKYNLAVDKNTDYGNSFDKIMDKLVEHNIDPLQGLYIRLADKFNRFETLLFSDTQKVNDESIMDTLRDMSNYVDLYMAWEAGKDAKRN